jgi:hypothetical protein
MEAIEANGAVTAPQPAPTDEELLAATEIRALLDPGPAEPAAVPAGGAPGMVGASELEPEPAEGPEPPEETEWPGALEPTLWIEALAVPDTLQGRPIVFAAEPIDQAAVARLVADIGRPVPVVGRPIEDVVPRLRELFQAT